jgi:CHAT domain-containing protein
MEYSTHRGDFPVGKEDNVWFWNEKLMSLRHFSLILFFFCSSLSLLIADADSNPLAPSPYENAAQRIYERIEQNNRNGMILRADGLFLDAANVFEKSLRTINDMESNLSLETPLRQKIGDTKIHLLYLSAGCYCEASLPNESLRSYQMAIDSARKRGNIPYEILALHGEARVYIACGDAWKALALLKKAESCGFEFRKSPSRPSPDLARNAAYYIVSNELRKIRISLLSLLFRMGKYEELLGLVDDDIYCGLNQELIELTHNEAVAGIFENPGNSRFGDSCTPWLSWDIMHTGDEFGYEVNRLSSISWRCLGNYENSRECLEKAMAYLQFGHHAESSLARGLRNFLQHDPMPLQSTLNEEALLTLKAPSEMRLSKEIELNFQRAGTREKERSCGASMPVLEDNDKLCRGLPFCREPFLVINDSLRAEALKNGGAAEKALAMVEKCLAREGKAEWYPFSFQPEVRCAEIYEACNNPAEALELYGRARSRMHPIIPLYCGNEAPLEYFQDVERCLAGKMRILEREKRPDDELSCLEDLKNAGLAQFAGSIPSFQGMNDEDRSLLLMMRSRIYATSRRIRYITAAAGPESAKETEVLAMGLHQERERFIAFAAAQREEISFLLRGKSLTIEEIQRSLGQDQVMLYYFYEAGNGTTDACRLWAVTGDSVGFFPLTIKGTELNRMVKTLNRRIEEHSDLWKPLASELYGYLIHPARQYLQGKKTIIIVPYGDLHYLPFGALIDGSESLMLERFSIASVPSGTSFKLGLSRNLTGRGRTAIMPDNQEKRSIRGSTDELMQYGFTPLSFKTFINNEGEGIRKREIIHLREPLLFSSLSPSDYSLRSGEPGLTFEKIAGFSLASSLFFAERTTSDMTGHYGGMELDIFYSALLLAGNRSLIFTLNEPPQNSRDEFVLAFYRELQLCHRPEEALRGAQMLIRKKYPLPCHWASYVLYGL